MGRSKQTKKLDDNNIVNMNEGRLPCSLCHKTYANEVTLKRHVERMHDGDCSVDTLIQSESDDDEKHHKTRHDLSLSSDDDMPDFLKIGKKEKLKHAPRTRVDDISRKMGDMDISNTPVETIDKKPKHKQSKVVKSDMKLPDIDPSPASLLASNGTTAPSCMVCLKLGCAKSDHVRAPFSKAHPEFVMSQLMSVYAKTNDVSATIKGNHLLSTCPELFDKVTSYNWMRREEIKAEYTNVYERTAYEITQSDYISSSSVFPFMRGIGSAIHDGSLDAVLDEIRDGLTAINDFIIARREYLRRMNFAGGRMIIEEALETELTEL